MWLHCLERLALRFQELERKLVSDGVEVGRSSKSLDNVGTFAIAYAAHKAASPIRFPPTVALTPVVANWIGQKRDNTSQEDNS